MPNDKVLSGWEDEEEEDTWGLRRERWGEGSTLM